MARPPRDPKSVDRYQRLRHLGEGATGSVWLVEDAWQPGRRLALKELGKASVGKEESLRLEFATLSAIHHPNFVEVVDFDNDPISGVPRFTMEYVAGEDIVRAAQREGSEALLGFAAELLRALGFLHDFGLIHRDLKPDNVLVRRTSRPGARLALLDFGLAGSFGSSDESPVAAGTLPFMAPEVFDGAPPGPRTDLYAAGAILHEAVHGSPLYPQRDSPSELITAIRDGERDRPDWPEGHHRGLEPWLEWLVAPQPEDRPAKASEALARLNQLCQTSFELETADTRRARLAFGSPPGREGQVERILSLLVRREDSRVIWLTGGAGIGKTRILNWVGAEAVRQGWMVSTFSGGRTPREVNEAKGKPHLVLIDQAESGTASLSFMLERLLERGPAEYRTLVALGVRPSEIAHSSVRGLLERAETAPTMYRVDLEPLDTDGVRAMVERATGTEASEARLRWLMEASEGNPLIVESLIESEAWERGGKSPRLETLDSALNLRLASIGGDPRLILDSCCVLGIESQEADVISVAELSADAGVQAIGELLAAGLIVRRDGLLAPASRILSRHVHGRLETSRRRELHHRAALRFLATGREEVDPWELARHLAESGKAEQAHRYAIAAAEASAATDDPSTAADRYALAVRSLRDRRDPRRRDLRLRQAEALLSAGRNGEAIRAFGGAQALSTSRTEWARTRVRQGRALVNLGRLARARAVSESVLAVAEEEEDRELAAAATKLLGMVLLRSESFEEASAAFRRSAQGLREAGLGTELAECLHFLAWSESRIGQDTALEHFEEAIRVYRRVGDRRGELKTLTSLSGYLRLIGRLVEAQNLAQKMRGVAENLKDPTLLRLSISTLAYIANHRGQFDQAVAAAREAEALAERFGERTAALHSANLQADALIYAGRPSAAAEQLNDRLRVRGEKHVDRLLLSFLSLTFAEAAMDVHPVDQSEVQRHLGRALRHFRAQRDRPRLWRARALAFEWRLQQHSPARAGVLLRSLERAPENDPRVVGFESKTRFHIAKARYLVSSERAREALEECDLAVGLAERGDQPMYGAVAHSVASEAWEALGDNEAAGRRLEDGRRLLERAAGRIEDEEMRRDFLARRLFRRLREDPLASKADARMLALCDMIQALNTEDDSERLLESILDMALEVVGAERGMILMLDPETGEFGVRLARNLEQETEQDAEAFSRSVIARAGAGESVLAIDAGDDDRFRSLRSVSLFGIRSLMCVPLRLRERIVGTVYIDSRSGGAMFTREDLQFAEAFADHAALALHNTRERERLVTENARLREQAESRARFENIIGESPAMRQVFALMSKVADSELPVLIQGASGTGKELVARAIHFQGPRRDKTFLSENCAAIPESLLESELFGHVRGAFTGAERDRAGLFEEADGGTLFLDEVGDMTPAMQARLLRVLQEGEIRRVGGDRPIPVDVRVIAASHRDLDEEVAAGRFREDLLYRLKVLVVRIPPLRERAGDIALLVDFMSKRIAEERGRESPRVAADVIRRFERYSWPGNVRQLQNVVQRLSLLAGSGPIDLAVLESDRELSRLFSAGRSGEKQAPFSLQANERERIRAALRRVDGNRNRAAKLLGISRATIYRKIKEYDLR